MKDCFDIQDALGSDIAMVLDECPPYPCERAACEVAVNRSIRWAKEMLQLAKDSGFLASGRHLFCINQGSVYDDLRIRCAEELGGLDFPGHAFGGVIGARLLGQGQQSADRQHRQAVGVCGAAGAEGQALGHRAGGAKAGERTRTARKHNGVQRVQRPGRLR